MVVQQVRQDKRNLVLALFRTHVPTGPLRSHRLETYEKLKKEFPESIDWAISENSDMTEGSQQLACTGNNCEL